MQSVCFREFCFPFVPLTFLFPHHQYKKINNFFAFGIWKVIHLQRNKNIKSHWKKEISLIKSEILGSIDLQFTKKNKTNQSSLQNRGVNGTLLPIYPTHIVSENTGKGKIFFPLANWAWVRVMIFFRYLTRFRIR